jgi:hypothetical protein
MELTLKRGSGLMFDGTNWNLAAENKWRVQVLLVPNGKEKFLGMKTFGGVEHAVFQCLNDEFFAQPKTICKLPVPEDPAEVLYSLEPPAEEEKPKARTKTVQGTKILTFAGKNWKLAADAKWKSSTSFSTYETSEKVGEKTIGQTTYDVYKASSGFIAVKQDE